MSILTITLGNHQRGRKRKILRNHMTQTTEHFLPKMQET